MDFVWVALITTFIYFEFDHDTLRALVLPVIVSVTIVCGIYEAYHLREQIKSIAHTVRGWK